MIKLLSPKNNSVVNVYTKIQREFLRLIREQGTNCALDFLAKTKCDKERSFPKYTTFCWQDNGSKKFTLKISETLDFANFIKISTAKNCARVGNLKIGTQYYWRVNNSEIYSFKTNDLGYRFIKINGAINVRDLGGKGIRQGVVFRGSEIEEEFKLTKKGASIFAKTLNVKSEISMREEVDKNHAWSRVCPSVRRARLPYRPYIEIFEEKRKQNLKDIFEFLENENNYPVYFHCKGGADRTGMLAIYLRALAGETEDQIFTDYELTSLSTYGAVLDKMYGVIITETTGFRRRTDWYFVEFINALKNTYKAQTFNENIKLFLLDCGIKELTLEKVLKIIKA